MQQNVTIASSHRCIHTNTQTHTRAHYSNQMKTMPWVAWKGKTNVFPVSNSVENDIPTTGCLIHQRVSPLGELCSGPVFPSHLSSSGTRRTHCIPLPERAIFSSKLHDEWENPETTALLTTLACVRKGSPPYPSHHLAASHICSNLSTTHTGYSRNTGGYGSGICLCHGVLMGPI